MPRDLQVHKARKDLLVSLEQQVPLGRKELLEPPDPLALKE